MTTNIAETAAEHAEASLRTRLYAADIEVVQREVECLILTLRTYGRRWRLVSSAQRDDTTSLGERVINVEVPVFIFTDDLRIRLKHQSKDKGVVMVNVRSASRVGKSDLGENKRHIIQLLRAMDAKFSS